MVKKMSTVMNENKMHITLTILLSPALPSLTESQTPNIKNQTCENALNALANPLSALTLELLVIPSVVTLPTAKVVLPIRLPEKLS